jgi:CHAT domain-containing protein
VILGRKGRVAAAKLDIGRAREAALRVADATLRRSTTSDVDMGEALLLQTKSPAEAIPLLTRVLDYQQSGRYEFRTAQLLLARGRSYVRLGDDDSARADFSNAIKAVESQRSQVVDLRLRSAFFGRAEEAYSELTALLVRSGEFDEARRVFDRSCERTLTEVVQKSIGPHSDAAFTEAHAVPSGTALVHVAVLAGEVVGWTMRSSGTSISRQPVSSSELNALIASYEAAIGANSDAVQTIGSRLYDLLVRPLGLDASADETVIFVTDRTLRPVPMASLYDRSHNRYLIDDFAIATAPSAAVYWHCSARLARDRVRANVVAIGNAKAGALSLGLADLPEAERELREVASQSGGQLLLNESATPGRLLAAAAEPSIIHFAGHAVVNEQDAGRSALVLAPEGKGAPSALLNADRIARASLRARLIVLSACATNATTPRPAKGAVDVSRAFLAAGVPTVVTSRWEVADDSARDLLKRFAREMASGVVTPAEALRRSQLQMLHGGNSSQRAVRAWCAFEVVGAV